MPKAQHPGQETWGTQFRKADSTYLRLQLRCISVADHKRIWGPSYMPELMCFVVKRKFPEPVF